MGKVISIRPQLLCSRLAKMLGQYLDSWPGVTAEEMMEVCNQTMVEIGAVKDVDGVWTLPEQEKAK